MFDLRLGDWRAVLGDVVADALIADPPFGAATHSHHNASAKGHREAGKEAPPTRRALNYDPWTVDDVNEFVDAWAPRVRGWFCVMTSHDLVAAYRSALSRQGRYVFPPLPCVIRGMNIRLGGDGPSGWTIYLVVARPRTREFSTWGTLPGAYIARPRRKGRIGGKPRDLMLEIVRDYSRPGDLVVDPCAGYGTTLRAAELLGRRAVGAEIDPATHAIAVGSAPWTNDEPQQALWGD